MPLARAIVLAAGQGSRLGNAAEGRPKALMPVAGEALLVRTIRQLLARHFTDITVVIGFQAERIKAVLSSHFSTLRWAENVRYATDTNIHSLLLGLNGSDTPALVIEADIAFDDAAMDALARAAAGDESIWFSNGPFVAPMLGGILRARDDSRLDDLRYVPAYSIQFSGYKKLLGVVYSAAREMPVFHRLLREAAERTLAQYYMMPWCEHLDELPAREVDLGHCRTATFNTPEDYKRCCALFESSSEPLPVSSPCLISPLASH